MGWNPYIYQSPGVYWEEVANLAPVYQAEYEHLTIIGETTSQNNVREMMQIGTESQELNYSVASETSVSVTGLQGTPVFQKNVDYVLSPATETSNVRIALMVDSPSTINATISSTGSNFPEGVYDYQVTAYSFNGLESETICNTSVAVTGGATSILLSWDAVPNASGYRLYRGEDGALPTLLAELSGQSLTNYEDDNSTPPNKTTRPGDLSNHNICLVSYSYTDPDKFKIHYFYDSDQVENFYGPATKNFSINEPISFAAKLAALNGYTVFRTIAVPFSATTEEWLAALNKLEKEDEIGAVCLLTYNPMLFSQLPNWISLRQIETKFPFFFLGGKISTATESVTIDTLAALTKITKEGRGILSNENIVMFGYPAINYSFFENNTAKVKEIDGYYGAVICAARTLAQPVYIPLTRKFLYGIHSVPKISVRDMERYTSYGLLIPFARHDSSIIVRHGVTADFSSSATREISVVRSKHYLLKNIINDLNSVIVGSVLNEMTTVQTISVCRQRLESARDSRLIAGYSELKANLDAEEPTKVNVKFKYRPSWPINWVLIQFAIDTTSGAVSL